MPGYSELIIIFVIVLLLFGGRKIPEIARGLGRGLNEFKKARDGIRDAIEDDGDNGDSRTLAQDGSSEPEARAARSEQASKAGGGDER